MKRKLFLTTMVASVILAVSCSKDDNGGTTDPVAKQLANLKPVAFPEEAPQQVATEGDWKQRGTKKLISTRKQVVVNPMQLVNEQNTDVIFPGSILRGDSFLQGKYDPIIVSNPGEITISTSLQGKDLDVKTKSLPVLSDVRQKINNLLKNNQDKIDAKNAPSYITYLANSVTSASSFNKSFHLYVGIDILKKLVEVDFKYNPSEFRINGKDYVLIKVRQPLYNIAVDPKEANEWGTLKNIGDTEPVYVSSVDYGRVAHLLIQTDRNYEEVKDIIEGTVKVNVAKIVSADVGGGYTEATKKWFSEGKIVAIAAGGPLSQSKSIKDFDSFIKFLETPDAESLIQSAVPIGYKVRTLKDNKEVEVRATYIDEEFK
jgi:flavomodulin